MSYTVVSIFPSTANTEEIKNDLRNYGFQESDIVVSQSRTGNELSGENHQDDVRDRGFWNFVFANDVEALDAYRNESAGKTNIVVYTDDFEKAQRAKAILNERGAIQVQRKDSETYNHQDTAPEGMSEDVYNGIIAKARHNIYFLGSDRQDDTDTGRGMKDEMDSLGSKD
ncbi:hypothetical protein MKJ01_13630 [Chryseobacterium sp. SSA4.19]|uniref:hypothetical protein n=1 Tax=Chryseobacterium sp. SSA4.19 TaxID=2919915 RepID=UPI001F4D830E|nr:hypothetical protein [Chryseobacterium sp. SSA4.19]MCJ8154807.1 hypothetical protein [Chryseobacterium sp. SSA4.19]